MIRPDAIPITRLESRAALGPGALTRLFGEGVRLRGSERLRVLGAVSLEIAVPVAASGDTKVELTPADLSRLGSSAINLVGPRGTMSMTASVLDRHLALPPGLIRAWRLPAGERVAVQVGDVVFTAVEVVPGEPAGLALDQADLTAARAGSECLGRLRRDLPPGTAAPPLPPGDVAIPGRLITENDVRQARLKGKRLVVRPEQIITPAALSLGRELGILEWTEA